MDVHVHMCTVMEEAAREAAQSSGGHRQLKRRLDHIFCEKSTYRRMKERKEESLRAQERFHWPPSLLTFQMKCSPLFWGSHRRLG